MNEGGDRTNAGGYLVNINQDKSFVIPVLLIVLSVSYLGKSIFTKTPTAKTATTLKYKTVSQKQTNPQSVKSNFKKSTSQSKHIAKKVSSRPIASVQKPVYKLVFKTVQTPEQLRQLALEQQKIDQQIEQQRKNDEIEYQKQQAKNFLSSDVGLPDNQVEAVSQQSENFNQEIQSISATQPNQDVARAMIMDASKRHHTWMVQHLGPEVYNQLRNVSSR